MKNIKIEDLNINVYTKIAKDWMLVTAGNKEKYNTMTASWGQMGSLWGHGGGKPVATIYIRPTRYTKEFVEREDYFSLTFFSKDYHKDLSYLGTASGRNEDKISKTLLTPAFDKKAPYFNEAEITLICRKLYAQDILAENFIDKTIIDDNYPIRDFHTMYIGEIEEILIKE